MATAALPWFMIAIYYVFILLPPEFWNSWEAWKENLLLSRFAAPTSAGILFTMLAAIWLKSSWIYKKIQVLAIFDDLDTILLMIPLQIIQSLPADRQKQEHNHHHNNQLPAQPDHHNLKRNH